MNSEHVILDDIWAWRAGHGAGVGWTTNTAETDVGPPTPPDTTPVYIASYPYSRAVSSRL